LEDFYHSLTLPFCVMKILGLETHTEWESKAVEEIFQTAAATPTVRSLKKR